MNAACDLCPCRDHCDKITFCGTLSLIFHRPPDVEIRLGDAFSVGDRVVGQVIAVKMILETGNLFVKLRLQDPDRSYALAGKLGHALQVTS